MEGKAPYESKTVWSAVVITAAWPFLPKAFRDSPNAVHVVTAWFLILRFLTYEAISFWRKK